MKYVSPTTPMKHQTEYLRRLTLRPKSPSDADVMALLAEMGTGKSKMLLDEWQARVESNCTRDFLVVAPAGSYRNWFEDKSDIQVSEMKAHLDPELRERILLAPWITGGGKRMIENMRMVLTNSDKKRPRAMFINVEALSTVQKARDAMTIFLSRGATLFGIDESTVIKGNTERTSAILRVSSKAPARRIMSGLVTPKSPMDLFYQFQFLDWRILGFESYFGFRERYAVMRKMDVGGRKFKIIVGYRNVEELQQKIAPYSYRVLKKDCLDLPDKTYEMRHVEMTDEQRRMYKEIKEYATTMIGNSHVTSTAVITQMIRLHQIVCGHVVDENGVIHDVKSNRIKSILELLGETSGKVIIWSTYRHEIAKIVDAIAREYDASYTPGRASRYVAQFHGGNKSTRSEDERRFLGDPDCRFIVSTQAAGGRGNTWNAANISAYAANNHDLELRSQSEDRNHRKGQLADKVTYVDFCCNETVEVRIIRSLRNKIDMATAITGENYREWLI